VAQEMTIHIHAFNNQYLLSDKHNEHSLSKS